LEWHIGVARVACSRVCAGGHHNSQQAQLLNFRFRERLFSYFRFALMERILSISRKSAYWRNVVPHAKKNPQKRG
jgi:hypothetical protein